LKETKMREDGNNVIRTLRTQLGMTQEEFAHAIQVTVSTVNRWENSHAEPSRLAWQAVRTLVQTHGLDDDSISAPPAPPRRNGTAPVRSLTRAAALGQ
jgi:DNA-binding XRE family transcriptional regulator